MARLGPVPNGAYLSLEAKGPQPNVRNAPIEHEEWISWCERMHVAANQLARLADEARLSGIEDRQAQTTYITMMLGPLAAFEALRQQIESK